MRATNRAVTATGDITGTDASNAASDWEAVRASSDIQFAPIELPRQEPPPDWFLNLMRALGEMFEPIAQALGASWPIVKWTLIGLAAVLVLWLLWRLIEPIARIRLGRSTDDEPEEWTPDRSEALALLEDADRLAAEGHYDEAAHLLLMRSVGQIAAARPDWLEPSSTAREIARLPALPDRARNAFAEIAGYVERSMFALRRLEEGDWRAARSAYADFALADLGATA